MKVGPENGPDTTNGPVLKQKARLQRLTTKPSADSEVLIAFS